MVKTELELSLHNGEINLYQYLEQKRTELDLSKPCILWKETSELDSKEQDGTECVYYSEHEGYLCKSCYRKWLKIDKTIPVKNNDYRPHEKRYLEFISEAE